MGYIVKICEIRNKPCFWARKKHGCTWDPDGCQQIIDKCEDCELIDNIEDKKYCSVFVYPEGQWMYSDCHKATHLQEEYVDPRKARNKMLNPIKLSKRKNRM